VFVIPELDLSINQLFADFANKKLCKYIKQQKPKKHGQDMPAGRLV